VLDSDSDDEALVLDDTPPVSSRAGGGPQLSTAAAATGVYPQVHLGATLDHSSTGISTPVPAPQSDALRRAAPGVGETAVFCERKAGTGGERIIAKHVLESHFVFQCAPAPFTVSEWTRWTHAGGGNAPAFKP
jgi:hypothetical protein